MNRDCKGRFFASQEKLGLINYHTDSSMTTVPNMYSKRRRHLARKIDHLPTKRIVWYPFTSFFQILIALDCSVESEVLIPGQRHSTSWFAQAQKHQDLSTILLIILP